MNSEADVPDPLDDTEREYEYPVASDVHDEADGRPAFAGRVRSALWDEMTRSLYSTT